MAAILVANAQKEANDSANNIQLVQPKDDNHVPFAQPQDDKTFRGEASFDFNDTVSKKVPVTSSPVVTKPSLPINIPNNKNILNSKPPNTKSHTIEKPIFKKPAVPGKQPKAVMPPKNDY